MVSPRRQLDYEAVTITRKIGSGPLTIAADAPAKISQARLGPLSARSRIGRCERPGRQRRLQRRLVHHAAKTSTAPRQLDVALDKASYKSGETAKLRIASKHGGKALIAVLGTGLDLMKEIEVPKGGGEVDVPVGDDWGPGAYVTAHALPADG